MQHDPLPATEMVRVPGLYRRWELPDVLNSHHAFRIEDAGAHQDGTPLLAIYAALDDGHQAEEDGAPKIPIVRPARPPGTHPRQPE
jgi:hypothetical protein